MLNTLEERWTEHGKEEIEETISMEGSLHPRGQVVTLHPTKQEKVYVTDIQHFIIHKSSKYYKGRINISKDAKLKLQFFLNNTYQQVFSNQFKGTQL